MILWLGISLVVMLGIAWVFRYAGQAVTGNAPKFRDMPFGVAYGYILGVFVLGWLIWAYMQGRSADPQIANKFFFLRIAIEGMIIFAIAAWLFRLLGRNVGTAWSKKLFRGMPLTASFGILTIIIYAIFAIFAGVIAPYGQEQIVPGISI